MGLFDNLDPVAGLSSSNLFSAAPEEPGMLRKGLEGGKAAVVGGAGGLLALGARAVGAKSLEEKGLEIARRAEEDAAPYAFDVREVDSLSKAAGVVPYALGALAPFVAARVVGGLAGGLLGKLVSGTTRGRNIGAVAGGLGVSAGLSAGNIFPDAVENNVEDPVARSLAGGVASGLLDQVAPLAVLRRAGLVGKAAGGSVGGAKGAAAGAVKGFFQESVTEVAQEAIERGAGGQTVTGDEAMGAYINAGVIGGIGGGALGGAGGAFKTRPTTPSETPSIVDPLRPPVTVPPTIAEEPKEPVASSVPETPAGPLGTPLPSLDLPAPSPGAAPEVTPEDRPLPTIGGLQPDFRPPTTPAPTIPEETTARLGFPRIFVDPRIAPYVDTTVRAKLAEADTEFRAAPEKMAREFLEPQLANARAALETATAALEKGADRGGRTKQQVAKERMALEEKVKGLSRAVAVLRGGELARGPEKTGSVALGQEINVGQEAPPTQVPISPFELDTLRTAAQAAPAFDRTAREVSLLQGNVIETPAEPAPPGELVVPEPSRARSRIVYDAEQRVKEEAALREEEKRRAAEKGNVKESGVGEYQDGNGARQAAEASRGNRVVTGPSWVRGDEGDVAQEAARQVAQQAETARVNAIRERQAAGELLSTDEVRAVRIADKEAAERPTPALETVDSYFSSRGRLRQASRQQREEAFLNNAQRAVDTTLTELVRSGGLREGSRKSVAAGVKRAFEEALKTQDVEAAKQTILVGIAKAAKGKIKKVDAEAYAQRLLEEVGAAPREFLSKAKVESLQGRAADILARHLANGGSTTEVATGKDLGGTDNFAVSAYKDREAVIPGQPTEEQIAQYIASNADLLAQPGRTMGTWFNTEDGRTYLDVSQVTPDREEAMRIAKENNQLAIFDLKTFETISVPGAKPKIRFTHWGNVPGGVTDPTKLGTGVRGRDWEAALEFGTLYTSAVVEGANFNEPAVQVRTKYSGELDADKVFDATNYRQDPRWAAAQEKVRERYGPDFAAAMAQFQKDVIAEGYDAILFPNGQLRIFKPVKVIRADANSRTSTDPADIAQQLDAEYEAKGIAAITQLERMLGGPSDLEVRLFVQRQEGGFAGRYRTTPLKDTIELAYNAKDILSLAAHEGFHRIETKHLGHAERTIIRRALAKNAPLYKQLLEKAKAYDAANGTQIAEEIEAIPQEAHAYGFEYWKRGELKVDGALDRVFQKIRQLLERVRNYIDGLGFRSIEDVYRAIDMGAYAKRDGPLTAKNVAKLYDAIDGLESRADVGVAAGWTPERIDSLLRTYGLSSSATRGQAYAVLMSPEQFLKLTSSARDQRVIETQSTPLNEQQLRDEFQEIYLDVEPRADGSFAVASHEGRHRMVALREAGAAQVPVVLNMRSYNRREMAQLPSAKLTRQKGAQADATVSGLEPITYGNRAGLDALGAGASVRFSKAATETAEFKKWFGDSKVVDAQGRPLVVYHATNANFVRFDVDYGARPSIGSHFGTVKQANSRIGMSRSVISNGAKPHHEGLQVLPVYLRVVNPLQTIDGDWENAYAAYIQVWRGLQKVSAKKAADFLEDMLGGAAQASFRVEEQHTNMRKLREWLESAGYDGIKYRNEFEGRGKEFSYAVFRPEQIKSATGNRGTFDSKSPDIRYSKAAVTAVSKMPGRPHWVKRPADVIAMRRRIEQLALEGTQGRNWHAESAGAILQWAGYDVRRAATLAALISNFSPRTPVGLDLKKALAMLAKWEGANVTVGAPEQHITSAIAILRREGEFDEIGNPQPGGIKRQNFFRNLMLGIDPEHYSADEQGATIDMWMAHAFGYANDAAGSVNKSEYLFADREVKLLARQLGWQVEETQAAIWVAIKARGNAARSTAQKTARKKGWMVPEKESDVEIVTDLYGEVEVGKINPKTGKRKGLKYVIAADKQRDYVEMWMDLALRFKPSYDQYQKANYNYATAFRDIRNGVITLPEGVEEYSDVDAAQDIEGSAPRLQFFSKASLDQVVRRAQAGEVERTQVMASVAQALDEANLPAATYKDLVGATASAVGGSLKRGYLTHFSSGMNAAKNSKGFANVFGVLTAYTQRKNRLIADGVESKLSRWLPAKTDDAEAAGKALLDRTVGGYEAGSPEWQAIVDGLTQEQRALFDQATAMVADRLRLELEADTRTMSRALGADTDAFKEWLENRTAQVERLIREGYVPERRYGDHTVTITMPTTDAAGRTKDITVFHEQYESEAEAKVMSQRYLDALSSVAPDLKVSQGFRYSPDHDASLSYQQFLDMARRFGIDVSQAEKERLAKAMISADSVRRNRIFRRKNVPGYSGDALRVLSEFGVTMANKIAYSEFSEPLGEAQKGTQVDVSWENGAPVLAPKLGTNLWAEDGPASGFYRNLSDQTLDYVMTPQKDSEWSRRARAAASLHFLGGSLAAGAVQLSSLPMVSAPYLSAHTGYLNAVSKLSSAFSKVIRNTGVLTNLSKLEDTGNTMSGIDEVPGLRNALIQAARDGTTLDTEIYQIMGMTRGGVMAKSRNVRKALEAWMLPFRKTEQWNRASTFIAAYNVGVENKLGGAELYKFAQEAVYNTQFRYDEANRPAIARNPIWAVMFTFKSYPIFMTEALVALAKEKPQAAVIMLLSLAVAAGTEGLPFAEDIMDLIDVIAQRVFGSPFNSQRALRNVAKAASEAIVGVDLSGVLTHGLVNELTGLSFASRVGMGNLIPGTRLGAADADFKRVAEEIIGPVAGMVGGWAAGAGNVLKGNFAEAFSAAAPTAMKNLAKGASQWDKGFATDAGGRKLVDVGGFGALMQGIGFAPAAVTHAYELDRIDKRSVSFYNMVRDDFSKEFVKAIKDSDYARISELTQAVIAWNTAHPQTPIALSASSLRRRVQEAGMPINERTLKNLPKQLRGGSEALGVTVGGTE